MPTFPTPGDYGYSDVTVAVSGSAGGIFTNIRNFIVNAGVTISVLPYDGSALTGGLATNGSGSLQVQATDIHIIGTIDASSAGFGGGGGGGGGGGASDIQGPFPFTQALHGGGGTGSRSAPNGADGMDGNDPGSNVWDGGSGGTGGTGGGLAGGPGSFGGAGSTNGANQAARFAVPAKSGGYNALDGSNQGTNTDLTTDSSILMGSGGGGGGGNGGSSPDSIVSPTTTGTGGSGGGQGGFGGGAIKLTANRIRITGSLISAGDLKGGDHGVGAVAFTASTAGGGGGGGGATPGTGGDGYNGGASGGSGFAPPGSSSGAGAGDGGIGAGGGVLLATTRKFIQFTSGPRVEVTGTISSVGGSGLTYNGGSIKIIAPTYTVSGTIQAGRDYRVSRPEGFVFS